MNVQQILDLVNFIGDKEQFGDVLNPDAYNLLLDSENINLFELQYEELQKYAASQNKPIHEFIYDSRSLRVFVQSSGIGGIANGLYLLPSNYRNHVLLKTNPADPNFNEEREIELLPHQEVQRRIANIMSLPIELNPVGYLTGTNIQIYPKDITMAELTYLRKPNTPVYGYTIDGSTTNVIYSPGTSTQLEWDSSMHIRFVNLIVSRMGINIREDKVIQYSEMQQQKEQ